MTEPTAREVIERISKILNQGESGDSFCVIDRLDLIESITLIQQQTETIAMWENACKRQSKEASRHQAVSVEYGEKLTETKTKIAEQEETIQRLFDQLSGVNEIGGEAIEKVAELEEALQDTRAALNDLWEHCGELWQLGMDYQMDFISKHPNHRATIESVRPDIQTLKGNKDE